MNYWEGNTEVKGVGGVVSGGGQGTSWIGNREEISLTGQMMLDGFTYHDERYSDTCLDGFCW
ncbi:hypothetical protein PN498_06870 [Oscillatoria sp. CS-180]|nr:hypothetical protein [Oscillatoria sp. CS-180]